jgi:hypothetical protein
MDRSSTLDILSIARWLHPYRRRTLRFALWDSQRATVLHNRDGARPGPGQHRCMSSPGGVWLDPWLRSVPHPRNSSSSGAIGRRDRSRRARVHREHGVKPELEGGCLCGSVPYACTAEPVYAYFCRCLDCQKDSGSTFVTELHVPRSSIRMTGKTSRLLLM